jgi:Dullard-like phosphatase family protein
MDNNNNSDNINNEENNNNYNNTEENDSNNNIQRTKKKRSSLKSNRKSNESNKVKFSKFTKHSENNIKFAESQSNLKLLSNNFNEIIEEIKKNRENLKRSRSSKNPKKNSYAGTQKKIISLTNREIIHDFYDYTENCMLLITDLKPKNKIKSQIPPKEFIFHKKTFRKRICVFDLDETLVHCVGSIKNKKPNEYQDVIKVLLPNKVAVDVGLNVRPNWKESLKKISEKFYIVVYTASHNSYADSVLNFLDPENEIFECRLYRKDCIECNVNGSKFYVKDLDIFKNFNLKDIIIIDNSVLSFAYHLENGIPIVPYYDSKEDSELPILASYLENIFNYDDLREANKIHIKMHLFLNEAMKEKNNNSESDSSETGSDEEEEEKEEDDNNKNENNTKKEERNSIKNNQKNEERNSIKNNIKKEERNSLKNNIKKEERNSIKNNKTHEERNSVKNIRNIIIDENQSDDNDENNNKIHYLSPKDRELTLNKLNNIKIFKEEKSTPVNKEKAEKKNKNPKKKKKKKKEKKNENQKIIIE